MIIIYPYKQKNMLFLNLTVNASSLYNSDLIARVFSVYPSRFIDAYRLVLNKKIYIYIETGLEQNTIPVK